MSTVETTVTYLEMKPPRAIPPRLPDGVTIQRAARPTVAFYRFLYDQAGKEYTWTERKLMADETLRAIVQDPAVEVYVLYVEGTPAGYVELDGRVAGQVEIAYFAIFPEFQGRALGPQLLAHAIQRAETSGTPRLWVHTCTLDHPKALSVYRRAGFVPYQERVEHVALLQ